MPIMPAGFGALDVVVEKPVIPRWDKATITRSVGVINSRLALEMTGPG